MPEVGSLWVRLGLDKSNYSKGINDAKGEGKSFGDFVRGAFQFTVGQGLFDLVKQGLKSAWDLSIGFDSQMQQNQIAFENMLGSADRAASLMAQLSDMAANTPFELPQLTEASKKLLAFGFSASQIKPMLTSVGDAAAGLGLGAEGVNRITIALG